MQGNHSRNDSATESPPLVVLSICPLCRGSLALRRNRKDGGAFIGCRAWPRCDYRQDFDAREQQLAARVVELEGEVAELEDELAVARAVRVPMPATIAKSLRELIALTHPDKWPGNPLAHEVCARLTDLRAQVSA